MRLPSEALEALDLPGGDQPALPSSYKVGVFAQSSIALSALTAALLYRTRNKFSSTPRVCVPLEHAVIEFKSERLYTIDGQPPSPAWGDIGGFYKTIDGYVLIHDVLPNHGQRALEVLGLPPDVSREDVARKTALWTSLELEIAGTDKGKAAIYALRSYEQWDSLLQSAAVDDKAVLLEQLVGGATKNMPRTLDGRCLSGLRVIEMTRVIAAPVAGKTLAAHGADVIWVTTPSLPDKPCFGRDLSRGKRTVQLDIHDPKDKTRLLRLIRTCGVFIQSFRPGSLASYGLSPTELTQINPNIIYANLSAFGPNGPWAGRRAFDSLIQTCTGMNASEALHAGKGEFARATPCQALDHAGGYLLATGIMAAIYRRETVGGAWKVEVSLTGAMKYLRSLGQYSGASGFGSRDYVAQEDVPARYLETRETALGNMTAVKHSALIQGCEVGWGEMPKPLGSDEARWA